jgi:hypothetical protein
VPAICHQCPPRVATPMLHKYRDLLSFLKDQPRRQILNRGSSFSINLSKGAALEIEACQRLVVLQSV